MTLATGDSKTRELATTRELANMFLLVLTFAARGSFLGAIEIDERGVRVRRRVGSATQRAIDVSVGVSENYKTWSNFSKEKRVRDSLR